MISREKTDEMLYVDFQCQYRLADEKCCEESGSMDAKNFKPTHDLSGNPLHIRPDWDSYLMSLACLVSIRSPDPSTKHGSIIVDKDHRPLGFGYNCYPGGGIDDSIYPLTRPLKYKYMVHSERNAIDNCQARPEGSTIYVTGAPCSACMQGIIQAGIKEVIIGNIGSLCVDEEDLEASRLMAKNHEITLLTYSGMQPSLLLKDAIRYLEKKWN